MSYVNAEIESHRSKSKACDKNITSILREVVKTVEERKKVAGVQLPLLKRAKKIFRDTYVLSLGKAYFSRP